MRQSHMNIGIIETISPERTNWWYNLTWVTNATGLLRGWNFLFRTNPRSPFPTGFIYIYIYIYIYIPFILSHSGDDALVFSVRRTEETMTYVSTFWTSKHGIKAFIFCRSCCVQTATYSTTATADSWGLALSSKPITPHKLKSFSHTETCQPFCIIKHKLLFLHYTYIIQIQIIFVKVELLSFIINPFIFQAFQLRYIRMHNLSWTDFIQQCCNRIAASSDYVKRDTHCMFPKAHTGHFFTQRFLYFYTVSNDECVLKLRAQTTNTQ
jgi:hypothetical protein